jgi:hypothetical protein
VINFLWSFVVSLGFALSGFLLRDGEFRLAGIFFFATWAWLIFPKIPMWLIRQVGRLFSTHKDLIGRKV